MTSQDLKEEVAKMGEKLLIKLKQIPQADTVEIISFTIIIVFIAAVLVITSVACSGCCCTNNKHRAVRVQPKGEV
ncbi:PREDICTED: small integral membrane protein 5 [Nanorana parkeri]|uniref:small integral membrane protein 5 n=1 Tax=Nanorana parkeri TaxID=125878 RepID=UPI000854D2AD|nr:PREDICTED: small integral membrane protein 5 [Nanorana parkeri]